MVSLPLTGSDIEQAQGRLKSDSEVQNFIFFIKGLDVYPDHANPKEIRAMENKDLSKKYYIAPFFQASDERRVVGGQELADEGIKIIMEVKDLVSAFDFEIFKIILLMKEERKKNQTLDKLRKNLPKLSDQNLIDNYKILIAQLEKEIRA